MKVFALIDLAADRQIASFRSQLTEGLKSSWALFEAGLLREAYLSDGPTRAVFVLETTDIADTEATFRKLPSVRGRPPRHTRRSQTPFRDDRSNGSERKRSPVAAKIAFDTAGATGGTPGSPIPVGASADGTICTSTAGMSDIRNGS